MYKLTIRLDTDGDFGYTSSFINHDNVESIFISEDRNVLINTLIMFYKDIRFKAYENHLNIVKAIMDFGEYLFELSKRYKTFSFIFAMGNYDFEIELIQYRVVDNWVNTNNTIVYNQKYIEEKANIELYLNEYFKKSLSIEKIKDLPINFPINFSIKD